jgi:hypothetical protein
MGEITSVIVIGDTGKNKTINFNKTYQIFEIDQHLKTFISKKCDSTIIEVYQTKIINSERPIFLEMLKKRQSRKRKLLQ